MTREIFTLGHSTRSLDDLIRLLQGHEIEQLVDVRIAPGSRRLPHFSKDSLSASLSHEGISYMHLPQLGGRRRPRPGSPNTGWRTKGFQGYADHMATSDFRAALEQLEGIAERSRSAVMCAEAVWWRCHRMLISDALLARGWKVQHIGLGKEPQEHQLTSFAVVAGDRITYPASQLEL